jgi:hypothetical protein
MNKTELAAVKEGIAEVKKELTELQKATALVLQEKQERVKRFQERLEALLKEERCSLNVNVSLQGLTLVPRLQVTALD